MKRTNIQWSLSGFLAIVALAPALAAERPTFNHRTCDPRPDILVHPFYDAHVEYRRRYNRPRCLTGWIASKIAPSSQEAMVWCENHRAGRYTHPPSPPVYKSYMFPKPWEVLTTGARPDTTHSDTYSRDATVERYDNDITTREIEPSDMESSLVPPSTRSPEIPLELEDRSPSDQR